MHWTHDLPKEDTRWNRDVKGVLKFNSLDDLVKEDRHMNINDISIEDVIKNNSIVKPSDNSEEPINIIFDYKMGNVISKV